jgi:arginyl-tRNA synthetase
MEKQIIALLAKVIKENYDIELSNIKLEFPPKKDLGDFAFGCFVLSRDLKKNPAMISNELSELLQNETLIDEANSAGPYINLKVSKSIFTEAFSQMFYDKDDYLSPKISSGERLVVDYIGANVGKPLHIGHICTPIQGQVMINLYNKLGYDVISDSHI